MVRDAGEFQSLRPYGARPDGEAGAGAVRRARARVESGIPELRPRSVGELLDLAFEVLRSRFGTFIAVGVTLWLPVRAIQPFIGLHAWENSRELHAFGLLASFFFNVFAATVVTWLAVSVASILTAAHLEDRSLPLAAAFRAALARFVPVAVLGVATGLLTSFGCMCLCIPGLYLTFKFFAAPAVCVLERASIAESVSRSFELSSGRFVPWLAVYLVAIVVATPFSSLAGAADNPTARAGLLEYLSMSELAFDATLVLFSSLFNGVATAVQGVVAAVWYFDCRARREGIDLAARLDRLRAEAALPAGAAP